MLAGAALLPGCYNDIASPFQAVVIAWDPNQQLYEMAQVQLTTLTSLRSMQGSSGDVSAGGTVRIYDRDAQAAGASVASLRQKAIVGQPSPVNVELNTANGLVYPEDYSALELLSFYAALEKSRAEIGTWGFSNLAPSPIVAHADIKNEAGLSPLAEGEMFCEPLNMYFLPQPSSQQELPPQLNLGAVAHAVGLEAWQQIVWSGAPVDPAYALGSSDPDALPAIHVAQSVRMGLADFLGALLTEDPRWFDHSLPQTAGARALDQLRCGSSAMLDALGVPDAEVPYDPYPLGTVIAYALWDSANNADPTEVAESVVASLPGIAAAQSGNGGKLDLAAALDAIVATGPSARTQGVICGEFLDHLRALSISDLPTCDTIGVIAPPEACE